MSYMSDMDVQTYSLADLVRIVGDANPNWEIFGPPKPERLEEERSTLARRVRHWTTVGALPTVGVVHAGTGRRRRYEIMAVHLTAILNHIADWGLPIGVLKNLSLGLQSDFVRDPDLWEAAIKGNQTVFLHFKSQVSEKDPEVMAISYGLFTEDGVTAFVTQADDTSGMYLGLTGLFRRLKP